MQIGKHLTVNTNVRICAYASISCLCIAIVSTILFKNNVRIISARIKGNIIISNNINRFLMCFFYIHSVAFIIFSYAVSKSKLYNIWGKDLSSSDWIERLEENSYLFLKSCVLTKNTIKHLSEYKGILTLKNCSLAEDAKISFGKMKTTLDIKDKKTLEALFPYIQEVQNLWITNTDISLEIRKKLLLFKGGSLTLDRCRHVENNIKEWIHFKGVKLTVYPIKTINRSSYLRIFNFPQTKKIKLSQYLISTRLAKDLANGKCDTQIENSQCLPGAAQELLKFRGGFFEFDKTSLQDKKLSFFEKIKASMKTVIASEEKEEREVKLEGKLMLTDCTFSAAAIDVLKKRTNVQYFLTEDTPKELIHTLKDAKLTWCASGKLLKKFDSFIENFSDLFISDENFSQDIFTKLMSFKGKLEIHYSRLEQMTMIPWLHFKGKKYFSILLKPMTVMKRK